MEKIRLLIIEDEPTMRLGMSHFFLSKGYDVKTCEDGQKGMNLIQSEYFDIVISDLKLPKYDGLTILKKVKEVSPNTAVIIMTAYGDVKTAVQAIKDGAFDYITKPFSNEELVLIIERILGFKRLQSEIDELKAKVQDQGRFDNLIGVSPQMRDIFDKISVVALTDVSVLIQGESGTGKELVANAIHKMSKRSDKSYVKINCPAIPEHLFESELFGHEKGAFTGATERRKGKLEVADGGTVFFDEIGDMPLGLQVKLLRVIEDGTITRIGSNDPIKVSVRGIYATSKNLKECIASGSFREDLFYRINVVPIHIPPLRERKEDIPPLLEFFLKNFADKYDKQSIKVSPSAYESLMLYDYPGNVRELKHCIERAVLLSKNGVIDIKDLSEEFQSIGHVGTGRSENLTLNENIMSFERELIKSILYQTKGKRIEAAKMLGISRKVLWKKIKEHGLE